MSRNIINIKVFPNYYGHNHWNASILGNGIIICAPTVCFEIKIIDYVVYILKEFKLFQDTFYQMNPKNSFHKVGKFYL